MKEPPVGFDRSFEKKTYMFFSDQAEDPAHPVADHREKQKN